MRNDTQGRQLPSNFIEIKAWAENNDRRISRMIALDMLKDADSNINMDDLEQVLVELRENGIRIDSDTEDESYSEPVLTENDNRFIPADVNILSQTLSLDRLVDRIRHDEIDLHPDFQRAEGLWSDEQKSRLIESLMLKIPLPEFYFDASDDDKWVVIDGLQRLTAIKRIIVDIDTPLVLNGLEYLTDFNGKTFSELPRQYQRRILEAQIIVYTVQKSTPEEITYNIFKRINTGGLNLTPQEIRHALYRGKTTELSKELAKTKAFIRATDGTISPDRMLDCEYITRYLAFTELDYEKEYQDNIDNFLIKVLKKVNTYSDDQIAEIKKTFTAVMDAAYLLFGRYTFRKVLENRRRGPVNKAIFEIWSVCLHRLSISDIEELIQRKEQVFEAFTVLLNDDEFSGWIRNGNKSSMKHRIDRTAELVENILNDK